MATRLLYFIDSAASGSSHGSLQVGGSAPATATTATEWIVNKNANPNYALMIFGSNQPNWTTTAQPSTSPTTNDCFRTNTGGSAGDGKLTGTFTSGNWTVSIPVIAVTSGGDQDGRMRVRIWRSANANGSSATEMTNGATQLSIVTNLAVGTPQTSSGSVAVTQNLTLSDEYVFVQLAWEITGAGGANGRDVLIRVGSTTSVTTTEFKETFNKTVDETSIVVTESPIISTAYDRSTNNDTISVSDSVTVGCQRDVVISDSITVSDTILAEKVPARTIDDTAIAVSDSVSVTYPWNLAGWWRDYSATVPWSGTSSYSAGTSGNNALSSYIPDPAKKSLLLWYRAPWDGTSPWRTVGTLGNAPTAANDMITSGAAPAAGTAVNGYAPLDFNGSTQSLVSNGSAVDTLLPASGFIIGVLFRADTAATADALSYNNPSLFSNPESIAFTYANFGGTEGLSAAYYDGAWETVGTVAAPILGWTAAWLRYASGTLSIKVNGGNWTTVATGLSNRTVTAGVFGWYVGKTAISTTKWFDGRILEVMTAASLTDTQIDEIHSYWNDRYTLSITVGNNVPTAGVVEEPTKYGGSTLLLRAPYASGGQPFRSEPVKGVTWNRKDQDGANRPTQGTGTNGFASASFNGTNTETTESPATGNLGSYISSTAWYMRVLCKTTSAATNASGPYDSDSHVLGDSQGILGIGIRNNSGTFQARACHYDTAQRPTSFQNLASGFNLIEAWFTGGTVYCSINGATAVSAGSGTYGNVGSAALTGGLPKLGRSWASGQFWGGEILEVTIKNAIPTDDEREMYRARYLQDRYNLTLGTQLPTRYPAAGTTLHGYGTADFQGNDIIEGETLSEYWSATAGSGWALVNIDSCSSNDSPTAIASGQPANTNLELNPYIIMSTASPSTNTCDWGVYVRNNSGTLVFGFRQWTTDGFTNYEYYVETSLSSGIGKWALVQWRYGSSQIAIRLNNGSWVTAAAAVDLTNSGSLFGKVYFGRSQAATPEYIDGRIAEAGLAKTRLSDDTYTDIYSYVQERYFTYSTGADDTAVVSDSVQADKVVPSGTTYTQTIDDTPSVTDSLSLEISKTLSDTVSVSDSAVTSLEYGKIISDTATVSDSTAITVEKSPSDTVTFTDTTAREAQYGRVASDTAATVDSVANTVEKSPSDTVLVTEQTTVTLEYLRATSDTATITDSGTITVEKSPLDSVTVTDSPLTSLSYLKQVTDTATVSDSLAPEVQKTVSDTISVSDSATIVLLRELTGVANDTISVTDAQVVETSYVRTVADTFLVTDSATIQTERTSSDTVSITESLATTTDYSKTANDTALVSDSVAITTERSPSDTVSVSDTAIKEANTNRILTDSALVTEQLTPEPGRSPTDTASITDTQVISTVYHRLPTDTAAVADVTSITVEKTPSDSVVSTDTINASLEYAKLITDTLSVTELTSPEVSKTVTDAISTSETIAREAFFDRTVSDTCVALDVALVTCERSVSDTISVTDTLLKEVPYVRTTSDTASVTDSVYCEVSKTLQDTVSVTETVTREANSARTGTDTSTVADTAQITVERSPSDTVTVTETLSTATYYVRTPSEDLDVLDSVIADLGAGLFASQDDSVTVSDQITASTSYVRTASDTASVADQTSPEIGKTATDTASTSDSTTRTVTFTRDVVETVGVTDYVSKTIEVYRADAISAADSVSIEVSKSLSDSISLSDSATKTVEVSPSDTVSVVDTRAIQVDKTASDSVSVVEQLQTAASYVRTSSESVIVDDIFIVEFGAVADRQLSDSISITETTNVEVSYVRSNNDTAVAADYLSLTVDKTITDSISVTESVTAALERTVNVQPSDSVSITDSLSLEVSKSIGDTLSVVDSGTAQAVYARSILDANTVTDATSWEVGKSANDVVIVTDSVDIDLRSFSEVAPFDSVSVLDAVAVTVELSAQDTLIAQDTLSTIVNYNRLLAEAASVQDAASITAERSPSDALSLSEVITLEKAFSRALSVDALAIIDTVIIEKSGDVRIELDTDEIDTEDTIVSSSDYLLLLAADSLNLTDSTEAVKALHLEVLLEGASSVTASGESIAQRPRPPARPTPDPVPTTYGYISVKPAAPTLPGQIFPVAGIGNPYSTIESLLLYRGVKADVVILVNGYRVYRIQSHDLWKLDADRIGSFVRHGPSTIYRVDMTDPTEVTAPIGYWRPVY